MLDIDTEKRIDCLIDSLTTKEKISMCKGEGLFRNGGVPRLNIPPLVMSDGTCGVRQDYDNDEWNAVRLSYVNVTYLPVNIAVAATWNPERAKACGAVLGREARGRGKDMILAPGVNIMRTPLCGRNYEYMGEDPLLASRIAVPYVMGIQGEGVSACVKHFALNNQETNRYEVSVEVSERALREIYLPAFKAAVCDGGAYAVMGAYNRFRDEFCCENAYLLKDILKGEWGFDGAVVSDWGAVHDTAAAAAGGLDLEMNVKTGPEDYCFTSLSDYIKSGEVKTEDLNDKVRRILRVMFRVGVFSNDRPSGGFNLPESRRECLETARQSIVLLKNNGGLLPLDPQEIKRLLVVGPGADRQSAPSVADEDSGGINALYEITPLTGIMMRLGGNVKICYEPGCCTDEDKRAALISRAAEKAKEADAVIFIGGLGRAFDREGADRQSIDLPYGQDELIKALLDANKKTAVVITSGSPVGMSRWIDGADAVVQNWYSGMEGGTALAQVLFGDVSPSGKLPFTIPYKTQDGPEFTLGEYPGDETVRYDEGVLVGYRYYDTKAVEPLFCFGHGLSYTRFKYGPVSAGVEYEKDDFKVIVRSEIENVGKVAGGEAVQLYIAPISPTVDRPVQELRGFCKVFLEPDTQTPVSFSLDKTAFSYYDETQKCWVCEKGHYQLRLSASSRDVRSVCNVYIAETKKFR